MLCAGKFPRIYIRVIILPFYEDIICKGLISVALFDFAQIFIFLSFPTQR